MSQKAVLFGMSSIALISVVGLCLALYNFHVEQRELIFELQVDNRKYRERINRNDFKRKRSRRLVVRGAVGDGVTDDTRAIQKAINKASKGTADGTVILQKGNFLIRRTLKLKGGVTLRGQGYGSSPLAIKLDEGGTIISYCGDDYAITVVGHSASLENLAVYDTPYPANSDCSSLKAKGGILIDADAKLVESITMRNILLYWFMGGTSLTLRSQNAGGIAYASFENLRVRHAKVGIHLVAKDSQSFVNSNTFHDGAISGGIDDVAVLAEGPGACNDNQFEGMVIEPPSTSDTHVRVRGYKTNVRMNNIRLEGSNMAAHKPLVIIEGDSYGNVMNGLMGHTFVQADFNRNPGIDFATNKMVGVDPSPLNQLWNAALNGLESTLGPLPGWALSGSNFQLTIVAANSESQRYPAHNIMDVTFTSAGTLEFKPDILDASPIHSFCTFGIYARTSSQGSIVAVMKSSNGNTITSSSHTGSGEWEFIGMSSLYDSSTGPLPYFLITGDVMLTAPTFTYGHSPATPGSELLSGSGARMAGLMTMNMVKFVPPEDSDRWILPLEANIYDVQNFADNSEPCTTSYKYVRRINESVANRFPPGSMITLLLPACGGCTPCLVVDHGSFIGLLGELDFNPGPSGINTSITLVSRGTTWVEIARNS